MRARAKSRSVVLWIVAVACCTVLCGFAGPGQQQMSVAAVPGSPSAAAANSPSQPVGTFHEQVGQLFQGSCIGCHNAKTLSGDLDLERFLPAGDQEGLQNCDLLQAVQQRLQTGTMPPQGVPRPPAAKLLAATSWIEHACADEPNAGAERAIEASATPILPVHVEPVVPVQPSDGATTAQNFDFVVKPMIRSSCGACHNETTVAGDLDLTRFLKVSGDEALKDRDLWETVARRVQLRQMPPAGTQALDPHEIAGVTQWIQKQYGDMDAQATPDPGRVTARRLNRREYNNTVHDLLGVSLNASADFPPDPYAYGFDDIGEALSLSPALTELYLKAAQHVAQAAIPTGLPAEAVSTKYDAASLGQRNRPAVEITHDFPTDAAYNLRMAWDQQMPKGTIVTGHILLDGREVFTRRFAYDIAQERALTALQVPVMQGSHRIVVRMELAPNSQQPRPLRGPLPYPISIEVIGPFHPVPFEKTASFQKIFFKGAPAPGAQAAYRNQIIQRLAFHAYRRPPTQAEMRRIGALADLVREHGGNFYKQVQVALEALLMSPNFLFRVEMDPANCAIHRVSDYELASRLSYFLWSSMPDVQLFEDAAKGRLHDPAALHAEVRRMLASPRSAELARNFSGQWLQTQNLNFETPDAKTFPQYDLQLRDAMQTETEMFFTAVLHDDRSVLDFLDGNYSFMNDRLAAFYGIQGVTGPEFRRVSLEGTGRAGVLTEASVLTATSYPTRTSPTVRGKWVLSNILNTPPPDPPTNVPSLATSAEGSKAKSIHERLGAHRANPVCASCHAGMDPLGFALEHYNAIGQYRDVDDGFTVDASGTLPDGTKLDGAAQLQVLLLKQSSKFINCISEKLLTYGLGRGLTPADRPAVHRIEKALDANGDRFSSLVNAIVDSAPFQMRKPQAPATTTQHLASVTAPAETAHKMGGKS